MSSGLTPLVAWGAALVAVAVGGRIGFGLADEPAGLLALAGLGSLVVGIAAGLAERHRPHGAAGRAAPRPWSSPPTLTLVLGGVLVLVGVGAIGQAVAALGVVLGLVGGYGVARERRQRTHGATLADGDGGGTR